MTKPAPEAVPSDFQVQASTTENIRRAAREIAAELREHPEHWTRLPGEDHSARDSAGNIVKGEEPVRLCLVSARVIREAGLRLRHDNRQETRRTRRCALLLE